MNDLRGNDVGSAIQGFVGTTDQYPRFQSELRNMLLRPNPSLRGVQGQKAWHSLGSFQRVFMENTKMANMILYRFVHKTSRRLVLSTEFDAGNLPGGAKDWLFQNTFEIGRGGPPRVGASDDEILDAIEKQGFFILQGDEAIPPIDATR